MLAWGLHLYFDMNVTISIELRNFLICLGGEGPLDIDGDSPTVLFDGGEGAWILCEAKEVQMAVAGLCGSLSFFTEEEALDAAQQFAEIRNRQVYRII